MQTKCPKCAYEWETDTDHMVGKSEVLPACWCGETLKECGLPDFIGDNSPDAICTIHYECPEHGTDYMAAPPSPVPGIAISGKAGSGKSTLAEMLVTKLGGLWHVESLSEALVEELADILSWESHVDIMTSPLFRSLINHHKEKFRPRLIKLGQQRRAEDPDYWIKRLSCSPNAIIPNVRFKNEYAYFRKRGFYMVRVEALPEVREARGCPDLDDISETDLDSVELHQWNYLVFNNKSLDDLDYQADCIANIIKGRIESAV